VMTVLRPAPWNARAIKPDKKLRRRGADSPASHCSTIGPHWQETTPPSMHCAAPGPGRPAVPTGPHASRHTSSQVGMTGWAVRVAVPRGYGAADTGAGAPACGRR
jgi:hypothetical protein